MSIRIKLRREVCRCGEDLSNKVINGQQCLNCGSFTESTKCDRYHLTPRFRPSKYTKCQQCGRIHLISQDSSLCYDCGIKKVKYPLPGNRFNYHCPSCDYEVRDFHKKSHIPSEYRKMTLQRLDRNSINATLIEYIEDSLENPHQNKEWVTIVGPTGSGKTTLACLLARTMIRGRIPVVYYPCLTYLSECREIMEFGNINSRTLREKHQAIKDSPVLLFDDIYERKYSNLEQDKIYELISHRDAEGLKTIITTQYVYKDLKIAIGNSTASRIYGRAQFFPAGCKSMRKQPL